MDLCFQSSTELKVMTEENHSVLMIPAALSETAGDYTCRAENVAGSVTSSATLNVMPEWEQVIDFQSPVFVTTPVKAKVMDGEPVQFTCKVKGKPTPKVMWYHDDVPVKEGKEVTVYQDGEGVCKLAISEVFPEDSGIYTCKAVNPVGETICATSLVVEGNFTFNITLV